MSHYAIIPASSSLQISTEPCLLIGASSTEEQSAPEIGLYDTNSESTSGTKILPVVPSLPNGMLVDLTPIQCRQGLYVKNTSSNEVTIFYETNRYFVAPAGVGTQITTNPGILTGLYCVYAYGPINLYDTSTGSTSGTKMLETRPSEGAFRVRLPRVQFEHGLYIVTHASTEPTICYE